MVGYYTQSFAIKSGLAVIALIYLVLDLLKNRVIIPLKPFILFVSSGIYGVLSGAIGTGSIVKAVVFKQIKLEKNQFVATMAATALPLNAIKIAIFSSAALINQTDIPLITGLLLASLLGTLLGKSILNKLPEMVFYYLVRLMLLVISLKMLLN